MANLMPFDELDALKNEYELSMYLDEDGNRKLKKEPDEVEDDLLDLFILAYVFGSQYAAEILGVDIKPDAETMQKTIYKKIEGKDFADRAREYARDGSLADLVRVAETDMTRIYNAGVMNTAVESGKPVNKRWLTMLDDRVRDSHFHLEGITVPLESEFYTWDGDSALYPGDFTLAQNNCNCRCQIELIPVERG